MAIIFLCPSSPRIYSCNFQASGKKRRSFNVNEFAQKRRTFRTFSGYRSETLRAGVRVPGKKSKKARTRASPVHFWHEVHQSKLIG